MLLRVFYALVPIICIVILQNFYIQSAIFAKQSATTRGAELSAGEEEDEEGKKILGEEALWISRMVCSAATAVVHFRTVQEPDLLRKFIYFLMPLSFFFNIMSVIQGQQDQVLMFTMTVRMITPLPAASFTTGNLYAGEYSSSDSLDSRCS